MHTLTPVHPVEGIYKHTTVLRDTEYFQPHSHTLHFAATLTFLTEHARVYWLLCQLVR